MSVDDRFPAQPKPVEMDLVDFQQGECAARRRERLAIIDLFRGEPKLLDARRAEIDLGGELDRLLLLARNLQENLPTLSGVEARLGQRVFHHDRGHAELEQDTLDVELPRSEERRVGKEWFSTCRSRWS